MWMDEIETKVLPTVQNSNCSADSIAELCQIVSQVKIDNEDAYEVSLSTLYLKRTGRWLEMLFDRAAGLY